MCTFQAKASLQEGDGLRKIALPFVIFENPGEFLSMDDDIETANLREAELFFLQTCGMHLLPYPAVHGKQAIRGINTECLLGISSLSGALHSGLILTQVDKSSSKSGPVRDAREEKFRCLIELVVEALLADFEDVGDIGHGQEVLHIMQAVRLRICVGKLGVHLRFAKRPPGHLQVSNKIVMLACTARNLDNFDKV